MKLRILSAFLLLAGIKCYSQTLPKVASGSNGHIDYFSQKEINYPLPFERTEAQFSKPGPKKTRLLKNGPLSFRFHKLKAIEVIPGFDSTGITYKDATKNNFVNSAREGLIPRYPLSECPRITGGAASLVAPSTGTLAAKDYQEPVAFLKYVKDYQPLYKSHKLYFDYGTETLDPNYKPTQQQADKIMKLKGYTPINWINKEFPGAAPIETVWKTRFYVSVKLLLGK